MLSIPLSFTVKSTQHPKVCPSLNGRYPLKHSDADLELVVLCDEVRSVNANMTEDTILLQMYSDLLDRVSASLKEWFDGFLVAPKERRCFSDPFRAYIPSPLSHELHPDEVCETGEHLHAEEPGRAAEHPILSGGPQRPDGNDHAAAINLPVVCAALEQGVDLDECPQVTKEFG